MGDDMPVTGRAPEGMAGLMKGLAIIEAFGGGRESMTVADAAGEAGISRAAARRCLLTLTALGYLAHDGKHFRPTPRMLRLGDSYLETAPLPQIAAPFIVQARDVLQETISATILDGDCVVVIARAESGNIIGTGARVGARLPVHCTASGRILLSGLSDSELDAFLGDYKPASRSPDTVIDAGEIRRLVIDARVRGYDTADEELDLGMRSLAVPIRDSKRQRVLAALSVTTFAARAPIEENIASSLPVLLEQAERIGRAM